MLLWLDRDNKIKAYNTIISLESAQKYILRDGCIWYNGTLPSVERKEGYILVFYYKEGEITYEYKTIREPVTYQPTQLDIIQTAIEKSNNELRQEGADTAILELIKKGIL